MSKTIDLLFESILNGALIHPAVIADYFGIPNEDNYSTIYGIYEGLIKHKSVPKVLLENCYKTNRLDELIHQKYTHHKSKYYVEFTNKNIKIGKTYFNFVEEDNEDDYLIDELPILTDDYCSSCNTIGYITKKNYKLLYPSLSSCEEYPAPPDCFECGNIICKMCSNYDKIEEVFICYKCENSNIILSINSKIRHYNKT